MHQLSNWFVLVGVTASLVSSYRFFSRTFLGYPKVIKASVAVISILGAISLCILIAVFFSMTKGGATILTAGMLLALSFLWFLQVEKLKAGKSVAAMWRFDFAILLTAVVPIVYVVLAEACDALSCDTIHHLAHLMQFRISGVLSFEAYSITLSLPNDVNFYAYVGATYLPLVYMFSVWLDISYEFLFFNALPILSVLVYTIGACFLGRVTSSTPSSGFIGKDIACGIAVFGILSTYYPAMLSGHPQLWSMGYPSTIANGLGLHLLAYFLFLLKQEKNSVGNYLILIFITFATVPLHSGFAIIVGIFLGLYWGVHNIDLLIQQQTSHTKAMRVSSIVLFTIFLLGWFLSVTPKLIGLTIYGNSIAPHLESYYSVPLLVDTRYGKIFTKEIFSNLRIFLLVYVGSVSIGLWVKSSLIRSPNNILVIAKLYITVSLCYLILFIPGVTGFLMDRVSFGVLVRLHWFTDSILLIISALISFDLICLIFASRRKLASNIFVICLGLTVLNSVNGHYSFVKESKQSWPKLDVLTRSQVLNNLDYKSFLKSLPVGTRYIVDNRGVYNGSVKHLETGLIRGNIIPPLYAFSETEIAIANKCVIPSQLSKVQLDDLIERCKPDYIIFWEWPKGAKDPLVASGSSTPSINFQIERLNAKSITVNVHKFETIKSL